jgi:hypothetical protein
MASVRQQAAKQPKWRPVLSPLSPNTNGREKGRRRSAIGMTQRAEAGPPSRRQPDLLRCRGQDLQACLSECPPGRCRNPMPQAQTRPQARRVPSAPKPSSARSWRRVDPCQLCSHPRSIRQGAAPAVSCVRSMERTYRAWHCYVLLRETRGGNGSVLVGAPAAKESLAGNDSLRPWSSRLSLSSRRLSSACRSGFCVFAVFLIVASWCSTTWIRSQNVAGGPCWRRLSTLPILTDRLAARA